MLAGERSRFWRTFPPDLGGISGVYLKRSFLASASPVAAGGDAGARSRVSVLVWVPPRLLDRSCKARCSQPRLSRCAGVEEKHSPCQGQAAAAGAIVAGGVAPSPPP